MNKHKDIHPRLCLRMGTFIVVLYFWHALNIISAQDFLYDLLPHNRSCFHTVEFTECNVTLWENFTSKYPVYAVTEPRTSVFLFTPKSPETAEAIHECGGRLPLDSTYDPDADTEIFIHGYVDGVCRTGWMRECKEQLFGRARNRKTAYNVILVDWTWGNAPSYVSATHNVKVVGEQVAFVINNIMQQKGIGPEKFHLIGHSLGGIIVGYVGRSVNGKLRRITALDPSLPRYDRRPPNEKTTYRDAQIVDVIHTDASNNPGLYFGDYRALGHADFYPNGGSIQLNCIPSMIRSFLKGDLLYGFLHLDPQACSHFQATQYYKLSISPQGCQYVGIASRSYKNFLNRSTITTPEWAVMGMDYEMYRKNDGRRGRYFLTTKLECPYYDDSYLGDSKFPFKTSCKDKDFTLSEESWFSKFLNV